ncbi:MAG: hypothetical protein V3S20_09045 [Dehalococcoidia bacterium]
MTDRDSGRSKGFGFMEMTSDAETEPGGRRAQRQDAGGTNDPGGPLYFNQIQRARRAGRSAHGRSSDTQLLAWPGRL